MVRKHEGIFICGYCKRETELSDEDLIMALDGYGHPSCYCGNFSYNSRIKFKAGFHPKSWQVKGIRTRE